MTDAKTQASVPEVAPPRASPPKLKQKAEPTPKRLPPHAVMLHNDDINGMDHVIGALMRVFHYSVLKSARLMLRAHFAGQVIVWTGSLEVAELKAEQLQSAGADPRRAQKGAKPLRVSVEALPT